MGGGRGQDSSQCVVFIRKGNAIFNVKLRYQVEETGAIARLVVCNLIRRYRKGTDTRRTCGKEQYKRFLLLIVQSSPVSQASEQIILVDSFLSLNTDGRGEVVVRQPRPH